MAYIGTAPLVGQYRVIDDISSSFNGATTTFSLKVAGSSVTAGNAQQLLVSLGGVIQYPGVNYTVNTGSITFTTPPVVGLSFFAVLMGDSLNTSTPVFTQGGTGSITRTVESKLRDVVSVKDFGAVGDGVTDDTAAIQAALNKGNSLVPPGTFKVGGFVSSGTKILESYGDTTFTSAGSINPSGLTYSNSEKFGKRISNTSIAAYDLYGSIYPSVSFYDAFQVVAHMPAGSTLASHLSAISAYVKNDASVIGVGSNAVGFFSNCIAAVTNSTVFGINTLLSDNTTRTAGTDTGKVLIGAELDFNVMNPGTQVVGISVGGNSLAQSTNAIGYIVNSLGTGYKWSAGFLTIDGAATVALGVGKEAISGSNVNSQLVTFNYTAGGANKSIALAALSNDQLSIFNPTPGSDATLQIASGDLKLDRGRKIQAAGVDLLVTDVSGNASLGVSAKITALNGAWVQFNTLPKWMYSTNGSGSASLGTNCPAVTLTAPYTWVTMQVSDGSTVYCPAWK